MADIVTLQNIARTQYVQFLALGAVLVAGRADLFYEHFLHHAPPEAGLESMVTSLFIMSFFIIGAIFIAVAQFSDVAAQRKVIQYAMGGYGLLAVTQIIENKEHFQAVLVFSLLNMLLCITGVYYLHKEHKLSSGEGTNCVLKTSIRLTYVMVITGCAIQYFDLFPGMHHFLLNDPTSFKSNHYFFKLLSCLRVIIALALMGAAQLSDADMKKTVQYLVLLPLTAVVVLIENNNVMTIRSANLSFIFILMLTLFTYACYPASCAKTAIRFFSFWYFICGYHCTSQTAHFFEVDMPWLGLGTSKRMGKFLGFQLAFIGIFYFAASQCDEEVNKLFLYAGAAGHATVIAGSFYYFGVINCKAIQAILLVLAVLNHEALRLDKICDSVCSICKHEPADKPEISPKRAAGKRSATPVSGGKKKKK